MADQLLWRLLDNAYDQGFLATDAGSRANGYAYLLRALADEVERRGDAQLDLDPGETADWLRAEADRAERVES
jgi:hypothetical protein